MKLETNYTIRNDIKLPTSVRCKYPFAKLKVGGSFAVDPSELRNVRHAAFQYGRRHKMKFSIRQGDLVTKAYRCWRTI